MTSWPIPFWVTLTTEYYYRRTFTTRDQVYTGVAASSRRYNEEHPHSALGWLSPNQYAHQ